jgi:hypothetical protein
MICTANIGTIVAQNIRPHDWRAVQIIGQFFEYRMVLRTTDSTSTSRLADTLRKLELVREFRISPTGD